MKIFENSLENDLQSVKSAIS